MAGLVLSIYTPNHNHNNHKEKTAETYLIQYLCKECENIHSIRVKVKDLGSEIHFTYPPKGRVKVRVWREGNIPDKALMLLGAMKTLDGLNIQYLPKSVRLVKA